MTTTLSSRGLARAAGITYRQVVHWTQRGFLRPTVPPQGSGHYLGFPQDEAAVAYALGRLSEHGLLPVYGLPVSRHVRTYGLIGTFGDVFVTIDLDAFAQELAARVELGRAS